MNVKTELRLLFYTRGNGNEMRRHRFWRVRKSLLAMKQVISSNRPLSRFLSRLLRHSRLSAEECEAILSVRSTAVQYRSRMDIVSPGATVDHACLVARGIAGRFDQMRDGRRQITALHIVGDMCDLLSVVHPRASWSITALSQTTIVQVPHSDLRAIALRYPNIAMAFWRDTTLDAAVLNKWIGNLGRKNAQERLAHLFCELGLRSELADLGTRTLYDFPLTQDQVADAAGLTPVHINRTLQKLRETGTISVEPSIIRIHDWGQLAQIGQFEPDYLLAAEASVPAIKPMAPIEVR